MNQNGAPAARMAAAGQGLRSVNDERAGTQVHRFLAGIFLGVLPLVASGAVFFSSPKSEGRSILSPTDLALFALVIAATALIDTVFGGIKRAPNPLAIFLLVACLVVSAIMYTSYEEGGSPGRTPHLQEAAQSLGLEDHSGQSAGESDERTELVALVALVAFAVSAFAQVELISQIGSEQEVAKN